MKNTILIVIGILLSVVVTIFALRNNHLTQIDYLIGSREVQIPLLILSLVAFGAILTLLFTLPSWWKSKRAKQSLKNENTKLTKEITRLREELLQSKQVTTNPQATEFFTQNQ